MRRPILIGLSFGLLLDVLYWNLGPYSWDNLILKFLVTISTPVAYVISGITGWPLQQEAAIAIYAWAIVITLPLLGLLIGLIYGVARRYRKSSC